MIPGPERGSSSTYSQRLLAVVDRTVTPPTLPLTQPWGLGLSDLLLTLPGLPGASAKPLRTALDRFGHLGISPTTLTVDAVTFRWDSVRQLHTATAADVLTSTAVERELVRLGDLLPRIPGRRRLVAHVSQLIMGLATGILETALDGRARPTGAQLPPAIPSTLHVAGRMGRTGEHVVGLVPALILAAVPAAATAVLDTAVLHQVPVVDAPRPHSRQHADKVAGTLQRLAVVRARTSP